MNLLPGHPRKISIFMRHFSFKSKETIELVEESNRCHLLCLFECSSKITPISLWTRTINLIGPMNSSASSFLLFVFSFSCFSCSFPFLFPFFHLLFANYRKGDRPCSTVTPPCAYSHNNLSLGYYCIVLPLLSVPVLFLYAWSIMPVWAAFTYTTQKTENVTLTTWIASFRYF